jgi:hypothetical protein
MRDQRQGTTIVFVMLLVKPPASVTVRVTG